MLEDALPNHITPLHQGGGLSKPDAKQSTVFGGIGQSTRQHKVGKVKALDSLFTGIIFVHRHDVLKAKRLRDLGAKTQRTDDLAPVNTI